MSKPGTPAVTVKPKWSGDGPSWARGKWPIFKFVGLFALLMGAFYAATFIPFLDRRALPGLLKANATASVAILSFLGEEATAVDTTITSTRPYSVNIAHGCDAIEPAALFAAAVLAFPVGLRRKLAGLAIGVGALLLLNLVRIISLYYAGVFEQLGRLPTGTFEVLHIDVWQPAFVLLSLLFWVVWALWATKPVAQIADAQQEN